MCGGEGFLEEAAQVIGAHWAKQGSQAEGAKCLSTETGAGWGDGRRGHMRVQGLEAREAVRKFTVCVQKPPRPPESQPHSHWHTAGYSPTSVSWDSEAEGEDRQAVIPA